MPTPKQCLVSECDRRATHRSRCSKHYRALRRTNPAVLAAEREYKLISRYGITADEAEALCAEYDYCCAICGTPAEESPRGLCVDHDHESGIVRGALCLSCNVGVAHFADNPGVLTSAIEYLSRAAELRVELFAA